MAQVQAGAQNQSQNQGVQGQGVVREQFGVEALDFALEGGVPRGTWVVVTGEPGVGKSILAMHFAWSGLANGEPVIYVTTESSFRDVVRQGGQFNMRFMDYKPVNLVDALNWSC